jgi:HAD superfamily hydrolase (TIGR01549 family)
MEQVEPFLNSVRFCLPGHDSRRAARRLVMWAEAPGNVLIGLPDRFGFDEHLARLASWLSQKRKARIKHFRPIEGVIDMLDRLHTRYPLSVVSARDEASTREFLRQAGIESYFICVAGALTVKHTKPYPDPIFWAAQKMGVKPDNCLMIGDTSVDIRAGKAAGAQTVGVLCGFGEEKELRRLGSDLILESTPLLAKELFLSPPL